MIIQKPSNCIYPDNNATTIQKYNSYDDDLISLYLKASAITQNFNDSMACTQSDGTIQYLMIRNFYSNLKIWYKKTNSNRYPLCNY